ncbi:MAG TPA: DUF5719 family protein [Acidimicrobiales bacterium]|jgi:hypothetical protein|nr:DUF5719 family protein [Acidimicrobiales bacterium]
MTPTPSRRVVVVLVLVLAVAAAAFVDRAGRPAPPSVAAVGQGPHASARDSLSSSWYCPGGPSAGSAFQTMVSVLNPGAERAKGTITVFPSGAAPVTKALDVGPASARSIALNSMASAPWLSALVDMEGGGTVVEQLVTGGPGMDTSPCSPAASQQWYFASGSTAKDAVQTLALFNPFPDDAIVDLAFVTGEGRRVPGDFQGLVVPSRSVRAVDIGAHVRRQDVVSTEARARSGRVVAGQLLVRSAPGAAEVSSTLGAPAPGEQWYFPDGLVAAGVNERYEFFNPGGQEARVDLALALEKGEAEPFEVTVPPQGRFTLNLGQESRVPKDVAHAAVAESVNGVPVVVERVLEAGPPSSRQGRADTLGARAPARQWAFAFGSSDEHSDEWVVVQNPGTGRAVVSFTALVDGRRVALEGMQNVVVAAGTRLSFRLGDHIKRGELPLVVSSTKPVVMERSWYAIGGPGLSASLGVPLD